MPHKRQPKDRTLQKTKPVAKINNIIKKGKKRIDFYIHISMMILWEINKNVEKNSPILQS